METLDQRRKESRERAIEDAIIASPDLLGYPDALAIRNWRIAPTSGRVDVGLLPQEGPVDLVLVEAKAGNAPDAASKCVGQLIMYYTGALTLGSDGLEVLKTYARKDWEKARDPSWISLKMLAYKKSNPEAWAAMSRGQPIAPGRVRLFLAVDSEPHYALEPLLKCLRDRHLLSIGLVVVQDGAIVRVAKPDEG